MHAIINLPQNLPNFKKIDNSLVSMEIQVKIMMIYIIHLPELKIYERPIKDLEKQKLS